MTEALLERRDGALNVLSMNRPERRNALNAQMLAARGRRSASAATSRAWPRAPAAT
jgi:enoyl-CoA hydratase/carnithine racemase